MNQRNLFEGEMLPRHSTASVTMSAEASIPWGAQQCYAFRFEVHPANPYSRTRLSGQLVVRCFERFGYRFPPRPVLSKITRHPFSVPDGTRVFLLASTMRNHTAEYAKRESGRWLTGRSPVGITEVRATDLFLGMPL